MNICLFISNINGLILYNNLIKNGYNISVVVLNNSFNVFLKRFLLKHSVVVYFNKNKLFNVIQTIKNNNINIGITYYFPIIPKEIWSIPQFGIVNIHYSLLYSYKGPDPVEWQLYNNEKETGVSIHFISNKIDEGNIIVQERISIPSIKLLVYPKLHSLANKCIIKCLELIKKYGKDVPIIKSKYKKSYYSYFKNIKK